MQNLSYLITMSARIIHSARLEKMRMHSEMAHAEEVSAQLTPP